MAHEEKLIEPYLQFVAGDDAIDVFENLIVLAEARCAHAYRWLSLPPFYFVGKICHHDFTRHPLIKHHIQCMYSGSFLVIAGQNLFNS